jgi:hypothetical protein
MQTDNHQLLTKWAPIGPTGGFLNLCWCLSTARNKLITLSPPKAVTCQKKNVTTKQYGNLLSQCCPLHSFFLRLIKKRKKKRKEKKKEDYGKHGSTTAYADIGKGPSSSQAFKTARQIVRPIKTVHLTINPHLVGLMLMKLTDGISNFTMLSFKFCRYYVRRTNLE